MCSSLKWNLETAPRVKTHVADLFLSTFGSCCFGVICFLAARQIGSARATLHGPTTEKNAHTHTHTYTYISWLYMHNAARECALLRMVDDYASEMRFFPTTIWCKAHFSRHFVTPMYDHIHPSVILADSLDCTETATPIEKYIRHHVRADSFSHKRC